MPTPHSGDPTAAQAPSPAPAAGLVPIIEVPIDTDPPNAATFAQALKVPSDYLAFLQNPFANSGVWSQPVWKGTQDAKGNRRFEYDHWGLPRASMLAWNEDFSPAAAFNISGAGNFRTALPIIGGSGSYAVGRQRIVTVGAACFTSSAGPGSTYSNPPFPVSLAGDVAPNASRQFAVAIDGGNVGNRAEIRLDDDYVSASYADDTIISCEWDFENFTNSSVLWVLGFAASGEFVNSIAHGAFFIRPNTGGTNWKCRTINGGSPTEVDSGVLASNIMRTFRIDMVGANVMDDNVARCFFWIDGVLVTPVGISATLPINAANAAIPLAGGVVQGAIANPVFLANGIRYRQITKIALL